jgi:hypothetical protein
MSHTITKSRDALSIIEPKADGSVTHYRPALQCKDCRFRLSHPTICGLVNGPRWPLEDTDGCSRGRPLP